MRNEFPAVTNREEFAVFLQSLLDDLLRHRDKWENITLENFLEAMIAWTEDGSQYYVHTNQPQPPAEGNWQAVADIMTAARIYE